MLLIKKINAFNNDKRIILDNNALKELKPS